MLIWLFRSRGGPESKCAFDLSIDFIGTEIESQYPIYLPPRATGTGEKIVTGSYEDKGTRVSSNFHFAHNDVPGFSPQESGIFSFVFRFSLSKRHG